MILHPTYRPLTLCELCGNAYGFCPWSEKGKQRPVPGWDAIRNDICATVVSARGPVRKKYCESYVVLRCPMFSLQPQYAWAYERFDPEVVREHVKLRITCGIRQAEVRKKRV